MRDVLFDIVKNKVFENDRIQKVSLDSQGDKIDWVFDFKGQSLSHTFLREYASCFWNTFGAKYDHGIQVGGMESGALPLIAAISLLARDTTDVTSFYIRKSRKKSDLANRVEGELRDNVPIVLVDDILNHGNTIRKQVAILEEQGYTVSAVFVCLRFRDMTSYADLLAKGIEIISLFELNDFSSSLSIRNLVDRTPALHAQKYTLQYKVALTARPNLYAVVPKSAPALVGKHLYLGVDDGRFYCLNADDGSVVWTYRVMFGDHAKRIFSSPSIYEDVVIFGAYDGNVYCLDRFSGKRRWVCMDADWVGSSPCIDTKNGIAFIGLEFGLFGKRGGVVAINVRTGKPLWKQYGMKGLTHASPAYSGKQHLVVCGCNDNRLYALDAATGAIIWDFETGAEIKYGAVFDEERGLVIFASLDGGVYVLHAKTGTLYHRFEAQAGFYATPILSGDRIIIGSLDKQVYCFNLATKTTEWTFATNGRVFASPILDGDSVFIGSNDGRLYELDVASGKARAVVQLTERIVNRIQIGHSPDGKRLLYVPTHVGELYKMKEL